MAAVGLNKVCLLGNVGKAPEIRTMQDGREMATFSLATSEVWKDKVTKDKKTKSEWHRIVIFSEGLVRVVKSYVKQGSKLYIEGMLQTNKWTGSDNAERTTTNIVLQGYGSVLLLLDSKGENTTGIVHDKEEPPLQLQEDTARFEKEELVEELDDEIPF